MKNHKKLMQVAGLVLLLFSIVITIPIKAQNRDNGGKTFNDAKIERIIKEKKKQHGIASVSVAIIFRDEVIYNKAFGMADKENNRIATTESVYPIGSITKVFTTVMMMKLIEEGKVNPDDYLSEYISTYQPKSEYKPHPQTTLRQLASHTSGLPRDAGVNFKMNFSMANWILSGGRVPLEWYVTKRELINSIPEIELEYRPSAGKHYSNLGFQLLGIALERASGENYVEYVKEKIFKPLKMRSMTFDTKLIPENNKTSGYVLLSSQSGILKAPEWELGSALYSGGIYSKASDLARFLTIWFDMNKNRSENLLTKESLELMSPPGSQGDTYLGWGKGWIEGHSTLTHSGGHIGYIANATIVPDINLGVVVMCNTYNPILFNDPAYEISEKIIKEVYQEFERQSIAPNEDNKQKINLKKYEGLFQVSGGSDKIKIKVAETKLSFTVIQEKETELTFYPLNKEYFYLDGDDSRSPLLEFHFNEEGKVKSLNFGMFKFIRISDEKGG